LRQFQSEFPKVRVTLHDLSSEEMLERLSTKKIQVALTVRPPAKMLRDYSFTEIARYAMCVAVSPQHPLAKSKAVSIAQVAREPLIGYSRKEYPEYHEEVGKFFAAAGCKMRVAEEHEGGTSLIAAVEAGHGVAFVPSSMACMTGGRLKLIPLKPAAPPIPVGAIFLKANPAPLVQKFIAAASPAK
jgi:DNA-binding transcriptional LysR family regulator